MKLAIAFLSAAMASAMDINPHKASISASSPAGQRLLSEARLLNNDENAEVDYTWVANMSIKYQGCYHTRCGTPRRTRTRTLRSPPSVLCDSASARAALAP